MVIKWFMRRSDDDTEFLFDTEGEMPKTGDTVYLHPLRGGSEQVTVESACHVVRVGEFAFECIQYPPNIEDKFTFAEEYAAKATGGHVSGINAAKKAFIFTTHKAEVVVSKAKKA